ncbi:hypothetical protein OPT61_g6716 [Boeremia exigua]|uniref:Uncharacterized protein n=1 Tax=Boeremia exigua TaxID=749465 RepID=A0ACC2I511_9PLEO|nr:hypothetical protein OPT61_g6716 [Boeremia exigua]
MLERYADTSVEAMFSYCIVTTGSAPLTGSNEDGGPHEMPTWIFKRPLTPQQAHGTSIRAGAPVPRAFLWHVVPRRPLKVEHQMTKADRKVGDITAELFTVQERHGADMNFCVAIDLWGVLALRILPLFPNPPTQHPLDEMGAVEQAVDAAANFIGPFVDADAKHAAREISETRLDSTVLVREAIEHLQAINTADLTAEPNAPYDASLAGVVYGLLDLITSLGILPYLSKGVAFSQRPRSVLLTTPAIIAGANNVVLSTTISSMLSILDQKEGTGLQPLLAQRSLPDIIAGLAELALSPQNTQQVRIKFEPAFDKVLAQTSTSRLLPVLSSFLQQPLPAWLKPRLGKELATIPLRTHGIRHVIEFLSLAYLSKNSQVPQDASGPRSKIPIPLEAVTQATRLLVSPPNGTSQDDWICALQPQLWSLLDGDEGRELSRAAGQIIAGGILSKKSTGAPGTTGWKTFARPLLHSIYPKGNSAAVPRDSTKDRVIVQDQDLLVALQRVAVITTSYSHTGLIKRLVGPLLLPLWAMLNYARSNRSLGKLWSELPRNIISRYMTVACDPTQVDSIATSLFWDGPSAWTLGPGAKGGIEIRTRRGGSHNDVGGMDSILSHIDGLTGRVDLFVSLLADSNVSDDAIGFIFLEITRRWLNPNRSAKPTLLSEPDEDPLEALTNAKLSEALAHRFKDRFARCPQHIIELMSQLVHNYVSDHRAMVQEQARWQGPSRAKLGRIVNMEPRHGDEASSVDTADDDLVSFAISTVNTLVATPEFERTPATNALLLQMTGYLQYLVQTHDQRPISSVIVNSARNLLQILSPPVVPTLEGKADTDGLASHRATLEEVLRDMTSPEAPDRTWALSTLHKLIQDTSSLSIIDVPATAHLVLSASLADPESYVHSAAIPVLVTLALRVPHPTIQIVVDAFLDVDERSLGLMKGRVTDEKERELQESLDYRLRAGEVLNTILLSDEFWHDKSGSAVKYTSIKHMASACLSLASRRGQRSRTQASRQAVSLQIVQQQDEAEAAWGGPIPNLFEAEGEASAGDQADYEALSKIVKGWEDTGVEEDVRIRASAMSIFGTLLEKRMGYVGQATVDAGLQIVLLVLTMETAERFFILRRAAALVVTGLLTALDEALEAGGDASVSLGVRQQDEVERVLGWVWPPSYEEGEGTTAEPELAPLQERQAAAQLQVQHTTLSKNPAPAMRDKGKV